MLITFVYIDGQNGQQQGWWKKTVAFKKKDSEKDQWTYTKPK